jgi:hypothetical protein
MLVLTLRVVASVHVRCVHDDLQGVCEVSGVDGNVSTECAVQDAVPNDKTRYIAGTTISIDMIAINSATITISLVEPYRLTKAKECSMVARYHA